MKKDGSMSKSYNYKVSSPQNTQQFAEKLAKYLISGNVVTLEGDLGAGKTTFTQGLAKGLGIKQVVNSPTFTIIKEYYGTFTLYHMDVYRLESGYNDIDFDEFFYGDGITVIEWPSIIQEILPVCLLNIRIEVIDENLREIIIEPHGDIYRQICEEFNSNEDFSY